MENLKSSVSSAKSQGQKVGLLVNYLANYFKVSENEIAILFEKVGALSFSWPRTLDNCALPIDEKSTAGKTFKNKKTFIYNKFADTEHVSLFEQFVKEDSAKHLPIQKIISTPFVKEGKVIGVVQVSRKGSDKKSCEDFNKDDGLKVLEVLKNIANSF